MVEHVYRRAAAAAGVGRVLVATDDERVAEAVAAFGGDVRMTSAGHHSGLDRLAEVAGTLTSEIIVNVQGDEPLVDPVLIDAVVEALASPSVDIATARCPITTRDELRDPNAVKVVADRAGDASTSRGSRSRTVATTAAGRRSSASATSGCTPTAGAACSISRASSLRRSSARSVWSSSARWSPGFASARSRRHPRRPGSIRRRICGACARSSPLEPPDEHAVRANPPTIGPSSTSSSPAASSPRSARGSRRPPSGRSSRATDSAWRCRSSTPTSTSTPGR